MDYNFKTWQTINLPTVSGDTLYKIYDHYPTITSSGIEDNTQLYDGQVISGYSIEHLDEILAQYVDVQQPIFESSLQSYPNATKKFWIFKTFYVEDWQSWSYDTITLTYDWSYDTIVRSKLSYPINAILDSRQFLVYTLKVADPDVSYSLSVTLNNSQIDSFTIGGYEFYNYVLNLSTLNFSGDTAILRIGNQQAYTIKKSCKNYCIYYLNKYGGWDSFLFDGKQMQIDNILRLSYLKNYNANSLDFSKVDYLTTINEGWELNTGWMDDNASAKMDNMIMSNKMFLHDLANDQIIPINITNSRLDHQAYINNGRKMSSYTINVNNSQPKYRV